MEVRRIHKQIKMVRTLIRGSDIKRIDRTKEKKDCSAIKLKRLKLDETNLNKIKSQTLLESLIGKPKHKIKINKKWM